jgi:hypothetical protein
MTLESLSRGSQSDTSSTGGGGERKRGGGERGHALGGVGGCGSDREHDSRKVAATLPLTAGGGDERERDRELVGRGGERRASTEGAASGGGALRLPGVLACDRLPSAGGGGAGGGGFAGKAEELVKNESSWGSEKETGSASGASGSGKERSKRPLSAGAHLLCWCKSACLRMVQKYAY